jgi:hypothetical protein
MSKCWIWITFMPCCCSQLVVISRGYTKEALQLTASVACTRRHSRHAFHPSTTFHPP